MRILLIEDDADTAAYVAEGLTANGHEVEAVDEGPRGFLAAASGAFDILVVDRMVPRLDGLALVRRLRAAEVGTPVLFLTAMGEMEDRVAGLEAGGDDYLPKPFALPELLARIEALGRRARQSTAETVLRCGDVEMDLLRRSVTRAGDPVELMPREFQLLEYLLRNAGHVVTKTMLLETIWHLRFDPNTNVVEAHMSRLRGKLHRPSAGELITTIRGAGYRLGPPA
ncbi:response regulator transcription factor [Inquilinus sp. YAF38]|uniref:response regulator transcription factor n=1 Tax=Inquilinus sp. YAF38 TaxID=3233084 RepID=UPI003F91D64F